ncbi:MAG: membrane protein insertase YidC [Deltaproteobacteria bacterium]|nr:membrane protein insertase YidC [Deltaproteobacteria bacterium]
MEDKRTALALFLCIVFIMGYSEMFISPLTRQHVAPTQSAQTESNAPQAAAPVAQSQQNALPQQQQTQAAPAVNPPPAGHPSRAAIANAGEISVTSPTVSLAISKLGGRISRYQLVRYTLHSTGKELVDMVSVPDSAPLPLGVYIGANLNDEYVQYTVSGTSGGTQTAADTFSIADNSEMSVSLSGTLANGITIQKVIKVRPDSYMLDVDVHLSQQLADGSSMWLEWSHFISETDLHERLDPLQYTLLSASTNKIQHLLLPDIVKTAGSTTYAVRELGDNLWVALANKYFMATLIPTQLGPNSRLVIDNSVFRGRVLGGVVDGKFSLYVGPKDYSILKELGFGLNRAIDLGIFSFLAFPLISVIRFFEQIFGNYGLAIILLTLIIKTLFLPLTKASIQSMRAMQDIQPEVKALRERIKDATQLNQEMMALYKRKGVNPMGGCLPMLIQIPVFLGLYNALLYSIELRHAPFALWINDLSAPESLMVLGIPVPVMILLMGASMFVQQVTSPQPSADPMQKKIMLMMPVVFTIMFVIFPFPSGLVLYWLVNNVISIIQQVYLRSHRKASPLVATVVSSVCIFCFAFVLTLLSK